ncbi:MAG: diaminopimelate epimerase [Thermoanaerobaculia bacterium]
MNFAKYHALGNDYLVFHSEDFDRDLTPAQIRRICHRQCGVGADGILWTSIHPETRAYSLRVFNPDGSEAEKSGNGARIFSRFLWDLGYINDEEIEIGTPGGAVGATVHRRGDQVTVRLGKASFFSSRIPVTGPPREVLDEPIQAAGKSYRFSAVTLGNPHCVIVAPEVSREETVSAGPVLETDPRFPNRTNVQFVRIVDPSRIQIEIWERGAGYTLSSGTSSGAAAAVVNKLGLCGPKLQVEMPGGEVAVEISPDFEVTLTGPVTSVCHGTLSAELLQTAK